MTEPTNPSDRCPSSGCVAFVDLAGFTALTEAHGDREAIALVDQFEDILVHGLPDGGQLVKIVGDAGLLVFAGAADGAAAVDAVAGIIDGAARVDRFPELRAGIHCGSLAWRGTDPYGATVNTAARIAAAASGGQILVSGAVASRMPERCPTSLGPWRLRNVSEEIEIFTIPTESASVDIDPVCQMRLSPALVVATIRHDGRVWHLCSLACAHRFTTDPSPYVRPGSRSERLTEAGDVPPTGQTATPSRPVRS